MKITKITEFKDNKYLTSNQKSIVFYRTGKKTPQSLRSKILGVYIWKLY